MPLHLCLLLLLFLPGAIRAADTMEVSDAWVREAPPVSRVLAALALHGRHFVGFQAGLLHSRDVVYYLAVTYFFLLAAIKVMEVKRWE